jgi:hypothetical protein
MSKDTSFLEWVYEWNEGLAEQTDAKVNWSLSMIADHISSMSERSRDVIKAMFLMNRSGKIEKALGRSRPYELISVAQSEEQFCTAELSDLFLLSFHFNLKRFFGLAPDQLSGELERILGIQTQPLDISRVELTGHVDLLERQMPH